MVKIIAIFRPHQIEHVKSAVAALGISGLNVTDVRAVDSSSGPRSTKGSALMVLPIRARFEVVVPDDISESVVDAIVANARTGEPGDGEIFIERVVDAIRIRTGERGDVAI
jgi:nitrogen regulatory protein P-II 1